MRAVYKEMVDHSLGAALSAIEVYNKPDFQYRNETFVILMINAWELLVKAKILKDNKNRKQALYLKKSNGHYKLSRTGNYMTIDIRGALEKLKISEIVRENIESLLEIRDTAIHFYNKDPISYTIFALGAATLQNYQKLVKSWFDKDLTDYNFYILPLGFKYSFKNFELLDLSSEPEAVQNLLGMIVNSQQKGATERGGFYLVADIKAEVVSAKKVADNSHVKIAIDQNSEAKGIIRTQKLTDRYPYSATQVWEQVSEALPDLKQSTYYSFLKASGVRSNLKYASYNFRNKQQENEYEASGKVPSAISPIYNQDAIEYILSNIEVK